MREASRTTRERVADRLREEPVAASALARAFDITTADALDHVDHVARSLEPTEETLLVAPPECDECDFADFDDLVNRPSRCPACKSESVVEPTFTIE
jgi:predicted Zn-ribbon and HTH transcriptional regulator